jgi:ADP-ribose pyrophosphatase YjhB (NUDIX family)
MRLIASTREAREGLMVDMFAVACYGIVFNDGNLLMVKPTSGLWANKWTFPGGSLKTGDNIECCIEKEVLAKTSCKIKTKRQIMTIPYRINGSLLEKNIVIVFYLCDLIERYRKADNDDAMAWVDRESFYRLYKKGAIPAQIFNAINAICPYKNEAWELSDDMADARPVINGMKLIQSIIAARRY